MKVGGDIGSDARRAASIRDVLGPDRKLMMDANQVWGVDEAIAAMSALREFDPWWIEEPTSPDDVLGHAAIRKAIAPIRVATGEHVQNRVIFKQLFQAEAIDVCQIDACRVGGVNEVLAIILMAAKFGVPVCPHAGGVGLCEYVQHLAVFDYIERQLLARRPGGRVGRPPARALPRSCGRRRRSLPGAARPRLQHRDAARVARRVRVPERPGLGATSHSPGWPMTDVAAFRGAQRPASAVDLAAPRSLPAAAGRPRRAPRRAGADPAHPGHRRQPDDARLPHEPQHRQRLLADRR